MSVWDVPDASMCLGLFIFLSKSSARKDGPVLRHEYGHLIQSAVLGPFYLLVVGLPSLLWAASYRNKTVPYDSFYTEKWATAWGERAHNKKTRS